MNCKVDRSRERLCLTFILEYRVAILDRERLVACAEAGVNDGMECLQSLQAVTVIGVQPCHDIIEVVMRIGIDRDGIRLQPDRRRFIGIEPDFDKDLRWTKPLENLFTNRKTP